jgi:Fe2+ transport system protein FeoA
MVNLTNLKNDQAGIIKDIKGTSSTIHKLQSMGIRIDKKILKISGSSSRGPQIIKIDNTQIALGFGIAKHIIVEI